MYMQKNLAMYLNMKKAENQQAWEVIAKEVGIGKTTMSKYTKGKGNPRLDTIEHLCKSMGVTPNMLLLGDCADQFVLRHIVPSIGAVAGLPSELQYAFVDQVIKMIEILDTNKISGTKAQSAIITDNMEEFV